MSKALLYLLTLPLMLLDGLLHFLRMGGVRVVAVRADTRSPQLVHLWHERGLSGTRYGNGSSENLRVFGHVALHLGTWKLTPGLSQRGIKLDLDSPFALRSLQHVARKLGLPVELGPDAKAPKGCPLVIHEGEPGAAVPAGPVLTVHKWDVDGGADAVSGEVNVLRYVQGGQIRWSKRGHNVWLRDNSLYAGLNGTAWVLYRGLDLRMLAWRLDTGEIVADRYLIGGLR